MSLPNRSHHGHLPWSMLVRLAWRNLWRHRKRTWITLTSITVGFGLAVFSIGLGDGSHNAMIRNAIAMGDGHLTIQARGYLQAPANHRFLAKGQDLEQQIRALAIPATIAPRISLQILASTAANSLGAALEGLQPDKDPRAIRLQRQLVSGEWFDPADRRGLMIGSGMAERLNARIGSKIVLMAGTQSGDTQAQLGRVRGIFHSGIEEMDKFLILSQLEFARTFLVAEGGIAERHPITRLALFLDDPDTATLWKDRLNQRMANPETAVLDWQEMMPQLVQFIVLDDAGNYVFLVLILVMVAFGILNTVLMSVLERTREFGLLRAIGLARTRLVLLVLCESLLLSLLAVAIGWLFGGGIHLWFAINGLDLSGLMGDNTQIMGTVMDPVVHTELSWSRVWQLTGIVFSVTLISGVYPALKAAAVTPVQAMRT